MGSQTSPGVLSSFWGVRFSELTLGREAYGWVLGFGFFSRVLGFRVQGFRGRGLLGFSSGLGFKAVGVQGLWALLRLNVVSRRFGA